MRRAVLVLLVASACSSRPARDATASDAARSLHALFNADWEFTMREHPTWASSLGDHRYGDRWDDVSLAAEARRDQYEDMALAEIEKIPRAALGREDALSWDLFRHRYAVAVEGREYRQHLLPINQRGGIQTADELADALPFKTDKDFADWNARLRSFPAYMDQTIELLAAGVKEGIVHPRVVMERVTGQIEKQIVADPKKSPFFAPYKDHAGPAARAAEAEALVESAVVPAFVKLKAFWTETYLPACKPDVGAWQLPKAPARYAYLARLHTTTKLTPDEIHAIGLREVARIRGEMEAAKARAGFTGTTKELFTFLRSDPRFFYADGDELLAAYRQLGQRIDPLLPRVFSRLPKTPYTVQPVPDNVAPDTTTAYYREPAADGSRPGTYFVNLYKPESRPKWEMVALSLHESVPGHHLQIALATEQANIPPFRRHGGYNAFVEGWALYAESLGDELGLYDDPWSKIGQLTYEMWRAVRLVVDTGIHHLKWDRQRAIDFFLENAPKAELDVVNEVDRYIAWPGQALAYKIGELKIKELRKKTKLDEKAFHEAVLGEGPLPLDVLEQEMKRKEPR
ncbi:MAG: DUF885 domain-containing protein [Labilithrix sp.]|nr:DUF885 domain-containing protein [Labilithrix sp.]MCW5811781.1 DUF885 domain-containing protein [Labilithrix sp.]